MTGDQVYVPSEGLFSLPGRLIEKASPEGLLVAPFGFSVLLHKCNIQGL